MAGGGGGISSISSAGNYKDSPEIEVDPNEEIDTRLVVSGEWSSEERSALSSRIFADIAELDAGVTALSETILYDAPIFEEEAARRSALVQKRHIVMTTSPEFLNLNLAKFADYARLPDTDTQAQV